MTIDDQGGADRLADVLAIDVPIWEEIVAHLRHALPNEGVGLLATDADAGVRRAMRFFPGRNIDASPTRFTMEPREVLEAFDAIRAAGWALGAIVHSHPATAPAPSATDAREAHYPDAYLLIVSFAQTAAIARAWKSIAPFDGQPSGFAEIRLEVRR